MPRHPFVRSEWVWIALVFVLAFSVRAELAQSDYFSDEPMSYALSRHVFTPPEDVRDIDGVGTWHYPRSWYLERPGFYLALTPAGLVSFLAYRLEYILIAATVAPLSARLLRAFDVRPMFAYPAATVLAIHPELVVWGSITHMDTPMTAALLGAFLANRLGNHRTAAFFFMWAVWTKETAMPFLVFVLVSTLALRAVRERRFPNPLLRDKEDTALFYGILLGFVPFILAQEMWFGLPGEHATGRTKFILDGAFLTLWLLPLVLANLVWARTRELTIWALALPAFYLVLHHLFDWNVREWYLVAPATFSVIAAAACMSEAWAWAEARKPALRAAPGAVGIALLLLFHALIFEPDSPEKREYANPLANWVSPSLAQAIDQQHRRDLPGRALLAAVREERPDNVVLVDVHYALVFHPIPDIVGRVRTIDSNEFRGNIQLVRTFVDATEGFADLTIVQKRDSQPNRAIRDVYADCVHRDAPNHVFLRLKDCPGRFETLYRALAAPTEASE